MAAPVYPSGVTVRGNVKLQVVPAIADLSAPSVATDINAAGSLDISCMVAGDGWKPALTQNKGNAPRRVCSKNDRQVLGASLYDLPDLLYSSNPQAATGSDGVKASELLVPGTQVYIVERLGLDSIDVDWAAAQFVNIWAVTLGDQLDEYDLSDEFGEFMIRQPITASGSGAPRRRVALAA